MSLRNFPPVTQGSCSHSLHHQLKINECNLNTAEQDPIAIYGLQLLCTCNLPVTKFVIVNQQLLSAATIMPPSGNTRKRLAIAKPATLSRKKPWSSQLSPTTPTPPKGATLLSVENCLHQAPWDASHFLKPWILFDHVDPLPKFRQMPEDYNWSQC